MSLLTASFESLDQMVTREKYLQSTFESLSGAELETSPLNKSSISSQYLIKTSSSATRNASLVNAARQQKSNSETSRTREELAKRISDTRKKLQSVSSYQT